MKLNVLYTFDNLYAPYAGISIHSLLCACTDISEIHIYCIGIHVSPENYQKIQAEIDQAGVGRYLHIVDGMPIVNKLKSLAIPTYRNSYAANLRLFFEDVVEPDYQTVLYLDCDTLVTRSLRELLSLDFGDAPVAVVRESLCGDYYKALSFDECHRYFNSGVILFTSEWKRGQYTKKLLTMIQEAPIFTMNPDQDYLNVLLKDSLFLLPPKYNFQPIHLAYKDRYYFQYYPKNYYTQEELEESRENTVILHTYRFCGQFPWHKHSVHPSSDLWLQNKNNSTFADLAPVTNHGIIFALERILYRLLPRKCFLRFFTFFHTQYSHWQLKKAKKENRT